MDKRNLIFFLYVIAVIASLITQGWVSVCDDLTEYLPATTETRRGLTVMKEEMKTFATARVLLSNVTYDTARELADRIEDLDGISSVDFWDVDKGDDETTLPSAAHKTREDYIKGADALITVTFRGENDDQASKDALAAVEDLLQPYDTQIATDVGYSKSETLNSEMGIILVVAAIVIIAVLLLTSRSYAEVPVLLITFVAAALLNKGTNFVFGEISFVSDSVTVVLQLALAIDYSIILLHRFLEEREHAPDDRTACIIAVSAAIPSISASSLTTISGLAAMMFMQFRIGFDLGLVLIKAILLSMLSVFTLMPGLLMLFSKAMERTRHKNFIPQIDRWGKLVYHLRLVGVPVFVVCIVGGFVLSNRCPYVYGDNAVMTERRNEHQAAADRVEATFGSQNIMAVVVPKGDTESEKAILDQLSAMDEVDYAMGLANVEAKPGYYLTDKLTPRQFSKMMDLTYEEACILYAAYTADQEDNYGPIVGGIDSYTVPAMDMILFIYEEKEKGYVTLDEQDEEDINDAYRQITDAKAQMVGEHYTRIVLNLNLPEEGEETFAFLKTIHRIVDPYYGADNVLLVGNSTSDYDQSVSFARDNVMISVLSVVFVVLVLVFTFTSVGLPILLILVIQGSIWINFTFPTLTHTNIFFMSYLIVTSIQMGANIDYAIVISTWYSDLKTRMPPKQALIKALDLSFPTVLTSGSILSAAGFLIGKITTEPSIVGIGQCLSRGTLISMFLVMFVLPQILVLGDRIVEKTSFQMKLPAASARSQRLSGATFVNGRVRGRISGFVDAEIHGVIRGDIAAIMSSGSFNQPGENAGGESGESPAPEKNENEPAAVSGKEGAQE
ncbi:MAG: MMPL family transporter [Clostridiales bacterium]|nr:MMPL family transporter [Clostridiales bacterium]